MSTYMYLKCIDHDPPILADDESGQHYYDLPRIRAEVENRDSMVARVELGEIGWNGHEAMDDYFARRSARFLKQHPKCQIRIVTEYGEDVTEPEGENR
nr:MAG TPA: hypothetical protein [Caudoviricetes sp.]